jgi:hypothetical protein
LSCVKPEILYLGHFISREGIKVDPSKIEAVKSFPTPQNQHDVRSFLGLSGYYSKYVKGYASINCSKFSNISYNLIFTTKLNDSSVLITIIACDYLNLSLANEY